jgi:hypothetical protein
VPSLSLIKFI